MKRFKNYYNILGVEKNATLREIEIAYANLRENFLLQYGEEDKLSERKLKIITLINEAYDVLSNEITRKQHDFKIMLEEDKKYSKNFDERRINESYFEYLQRIYIDVRNDEEKNSFSIRHEKVNKIYSKNFENDLDNKASELLFKAGRVVAHILHEGYNFGTKFAIGKNESKTRYVLRNRKFLLGLGLASVLAISNASCREFITSPFNVQTESEDENFVTFIRKYRIQEGDTLLQIAYDSKVDVNEIYRFNGSFNPDLIKAGEILLIPYRISEENLRYFKKSVYVDDKNITEIALENETNVSTIYEFNKDAIMKNGDNYTILSDTLLVPDFKSNQEIEDMKKYIK